MSNTLLTNSIIAKLALKEFKNNLVLAKTANRQYQNIYNNTTGDTISIRKPVRYTVRSGQQINIQDIQQRTVPLQIAFQDGVDIALTSKELTLQLDDFNETVMRPAMRILANKVDTRLFNAATANIYNFVGTAGTSPASFDAINQASAKLDSFGIDMDERFVALKVKDAVNVKSALYNTFNTGFNSEIILKGTMGNLAGFDFYSAQNVQRPAAASSTTFGSPILNGVPANGATSIVISGITSNITINPGALFTIAGVDSTNPLSQNDTQYLASFVVTTAATADGAGNITLSISPGLQLTGPYQNITALPANGAVVTFQATHTKNIAYQREAFTLACINLWSPPSNEGAFFMNMIDQNANVAIRMARQYDITNDRSICRFDILYGVQCFGEYGAIIMGS